MADDQENDVFIGVDVTGAIRDIKRFAKAFDELNDVYEGFVGASLKFNEVEENTEVTMRETTKAGDKLSSTLRQLRDDQGALTGQWQVMTQSITKAKQAFLDFNKIKSNVVKNRVSDRNEKEQDAVRRALRAQYDTGRTGSITENRALKNSIEDVVKNVGKNGITGGDLNNIFERATAGANDFTVAERRIVEQFNAIAAAANRVGYTSDKAIRASVQAANKQLQALVTAGNKIAQSDKSGQGKAAADSLAVRKKISADLMQQREKENQQQQRAQAKSILENYIADKYKGRAKDASPVQLDKFQKALQSSLKLVDQGKASVKDFIRILSQLDFNKNVGKVQPTPELGALQSRLQGLKQAFVTTQAEIDRTNAALKRQERAARLAHEQFLKLQQVRAKASASDNVKQQRNLAADVGANLVRQQYGAALTFASPEQIQKFNQSLVASLNLIRTGKVNLQQFEQALSQLVPTSSSVAKALQDAFRIPPVPASLTAFKTQLINLATTKITFPDIQAASTKFQISAIQTLQATFATVGNAFAKIQQKTFGPLARISEFFTIPEIAKQKLLADVLSITKTLSQLDYKQGVRNIVLNVTGTANTVLTQIIAKSYNAARTLKDVGNSAVTAFNSFKNTAVFNIKSNATAVFNDIKSRLAALKNALGGARNQNYKIDLDPNTVKLQKNVEGLRDVFLKTGKAGSDAGSSIFLSWQNVVRIFEAQILYGVFSKLQSGFAGATQNAAAYSKQIALIQTISQDAGATTSEWSNGIRRLSDALGTDIADTAGAAYEALSNQIAKGVDAFDTLRTVGQFAKTTNSDLTNSIDLISSALNSFNLNTTQTERVARSFFTTIDLGRVKTNDLAQVYGRVAVQAHEVGLSIEETNAAISVLTRKGIKPDEAITLLNNVFQKLLKPTEELKEFYAEINVASGQAAIATYGFAGVLDLLTKKFKGSAAEANKYFDELRGSRGIINLTGSNLNEYRKDLDANLNSGDNYDKAKKLVNESPGQQFDEQINKLKNFFTVDVGTVFLQNILKLTNAFGGLANSIITIVSLLKTAAAAAALLYSLSKLQALVTGFVTLYTKIAALSGAFKTVQAGMIAVGATSATALATATAGASLLLGAIAAVVLATADFGGNFAEIDAITEKYREQARAANEISTNLAAAKQQEFDVGFDKARQSFAKFSADVRGGLKGIVESYKTDAQAIGDALKAQFDLIGGLLRSQIQELESKLKSLQEDIDFLETDPRKHAEKSLRNNFRRATAANDRNISNAQSHDAATPQNETTHVLDRTVQLFTDRINHLNEVARQQANLGNRKEAVEALDEVDDLIKELGDTTRSIPIKTEETVLKYLKSRINLGTKPIKKNGQVVGTAPDIRTLDAGAVLVPKVTSHGKETTAPYANLSEQYARQQLQNRNEYRDVLKHNVEILKKDLEQDISDQKAILEKYQEDVKNLSSFKVQDNDGNLKKEYATEDGKGREKALADLKALQDKVTEGLQKAQAGPDTKIHTAEELARQTAKLDEIFQRQSKNVAGSVQIGNVFREAEDGAVKLNAASDKVKETVAATVQLQLKNNVARNEAVAAAQKEFDILEKIYGLSRVGRALGSVGDAIGVGTGSTEASDLVTKGKEITSRDNFAEKPENLKELRDVVIKLYEAAEKLDSNLGKNASLLNQKTGPTPPGGGAAPTVKDALNDLVRQLTPILNHKENDNQIEKVIELQKQALLNLETQAKSVDASYKVVAEDATKTATALSDVQKNAKEFGDVLGELNAQIEKINSIKINIPQVNVQKKAKGGLVDYYASGGFVNDFLSGRYASGTDTIPAMLTRGEYVMPQQQTRQFLPVLNSMRSGKFAQSRSNAAVTNVGDINITVQGGNTSQQTLKEIGSGLRRGVRRGVIKLS